MKWIWKRNNYRSQWKTRSQEKKCRCPSVGQSTLTKMSARVLTIATLKTRKRSTKRKGTSTEFSKGSAKKKESFKRCLFRGRPPINLPMKVQLSREAGEMMRDNKNWLILLSKTWRWGWTLSQWEIIRERNTYVGAPRNSRRTSPAFTTAARSMPPMLLGICTWEKSTMRSPKRRETGKQGKLYNSSTW